MASSLMILYEHAAGYSLFSVKEFEEIGSFLPQVESSVTDFARFSNIVKLHSFAPFKCAVDALEAINSISEGVLPQTLQVFLETNFPKSKKGAKYVLGVIDPKIAGNITELLGIECLNDGAVPEITRGLRWHFSKLVKGFMENFSATAQLGLSHSYSRAKIKFNVNQEDNMIIQSITLLDQLDKDVNTFSMRIREWYSYHYPELYKLVPDNYLYAKVVLCCGNRKSISEDKMEELESIVMDSDKCQAILNAARSSVGMDIHAIDLMNIEMFAKRVIALTEYRTELLTYLKDKIAVIAPNLNSLLGELVASRLIMRAGSLTNLAKCAASTVQILGAEKALFRALKTKSNTPKYGIIYHTSFIGKASAKNKGRISRFVANKSSIAARIDCFSEIPSNIFGERLREQVEERLKFYESGTLPAKNIDVMEEAMKAFVLFQTLALKQGKKRKSGLALPSTAQLAITNGETQESPAKKKKKKKGKSVSENGTNSFVEDAVIVGEETVVPVPEKRKKKKKTLESTFDGEDEVEKEMVETPGKKKKKKKSDAASNEMGVVDENVGGVDSQSKKKKKKSFNESEDFEAQENGMENENRKKKKKKSKNMDDSEIVERVMDGGNEELDISSLEQKKKKKKKKRTLDDLLDNSVYENQQALETTSEGPVKKKKKKNKE